MAACSNHGSAPDLYDLLVRRHLRRAGRSTALLLGEGEGSLSYAQLDELVQQASRWMHEAGIRPGDRVVLQFGNGVEYLVLLLAAFSVGALAVPLGQATGPERRRYVVESVAPRLCLVAEQAGGASGEVATRSATVDVARGLVHFAGAAVGLSPPSARALTPPGGGLILFSSGSTGRPKGVVLGQPQLAWTARALSELFRLRANHRELLIAPLAHSGAWQRAAATLFGGGSLLLLPGTLSLTAILEDSRRNRATGFYTPPPLVRYLLKSEPRSVAAALGGCRTIEIGSAPLGADELRGLLDLLPAAQLFVHYGLTECSRAAILDARKHPDKLHTVGRAAPGAEIELRHDGEILLRGPQLADGYWERPDLTRGRFVDGGVLSGDHGRLDEEGFLQFLGREDDMINCAGHSYFPLEVETELGPVEGVARYLVAGIPDPRGLQGDLPCALVVPEDAENWSEQSFFEAARRRLPPHMIPRRVIRLAELPRTASGKSDRRRAVELYLRDHEEQDESDAAQ